MRRTSLDFQCVSTGIFIGSGMQKVVALSNLVSYYIIGLPVGVALMFAAKLRILGNVSTQTNTCGLVQGLCHRSPRDISNHMIATSVFVYILLPICANS